MANMDYCRFNNTLIDVRDCIEALENGTVASESEREDAKQLLFLITSYLEDKGVMSSADEDEIINIVNGLQVE